MDTAPWTPAPHAPPLAADVVHVWQALLDAEPPLVARLETLLDDRERERANRFHFPRDGQRYIVGRGRLRLLLGEYLGVEPAKVLLRSTSSGKPELVGEQEWSGVRFNVAHSDCLVLYAVARGRNVGVDVERVRPDLEWHALAARYFASCEVDELMALPAERQHRAFFVCWTRKEAYVKALGCGLSVPLDRFAVTVAPDRPAALVHTEHDPAQHPRWEMKELSPAPGYVGAVAVEGCGWQLWRGRWDRNP
jgi:4'-phosphopantetheinyl transferase